jgi:alkylation response protein AidB-like acyl-CoA dehydrogenase
MAYMPNPLFPGDLHDTAARLAASLAQSTRGFATSAPPAEGSEGWRQMLELGWQGVWIGEADGGFGGSFADLAAIVEALGRQAVVSPLIARAGVVPAVLGPFASQAHVRTLLESHAAGEASVCPVLSSSGELPHASGHPASPMLGADGRLAGQLRGVDLTEPASHLLFAAQGADGTRSLVLTEAAPLLARARHYSSNDGRRCADLDVTGMALPEGAVLASGNAATQALAAGLAAGALLSCVEAVGTAAGLVTQTIDYLNTRVQFGVALSTFQSLRHRLVEMYVAYENTFGMSRHLVLAHSVAPQPLKDILTAKLYMNKVARQVGEAAIQLHGGMGMTTETQASRMAVRAITGAFDYGDSAQCLDWLAAHTLAEAA